MASGDPEHFKAWSSAKTATTGFVDSVTGLSNIELGKIYDDPRRAPFMTQEDFNKKWNLDEKGKVQYKDFFREFTGDTFGAPQPDFDTYEPQGTTGFQGTQLDRKGYNPEGLPREENETPADSGDTYVSKELAKKVYDKLHYDFDFEEFYKGLNVEFEHKDVTGGRLVQTAMIAAAHLRENPHYYSLLKKHIEKEDAVALTGADGTINGAPKPKEVTKMRKKLNTESKMIRLQDIIMENSAQGYTENRVNLTKIAVIMEKVLPSLDKSVAKKFTELFAEVSDITSTLNATPYTKFNMEMWECSKAALYAKICELKEEVEKLESNKVDVKPLVKALDEIIH